jgi:hypothetical protein
MSHASTLAAQLRAAVDDDELDEEHCERLRERIRELEDGGEPA